MNRRQFVRRASGLLVPALACGVAPAIVRGSVPMPLGFWKPASAGVDLGYPDTSVSGLLHLWKADSLTLSTDDPVSTWVDSKGGNNATGSSTERPLFKTSIFDTKPVLRFDGSNDFMTLGSAIVLPYNTVGFTLLWIWAYASGAVDRWLCSSSIGGIRMDANGGSTRVGTANEFPASNPIGSNLTPNPKMYAVRCSTAGSVTWRTGTGSGGGPTSITANCGFSLFGKHVSGVGFLGGDLAEVLVYNRELTTTECDNLYNNYFKLKYTTLP